MQHISAKLKNLSALRDDFIEASEAENLSLKQREQLLKFMHAAINTLNDLTNPAAAKMILQSKAPQGFVVGFLHEAQLPPHALQAEYEERERFFGSLINMPSPSKMHH